jgi:hypothetical protein
LEELKTFFNSLFKSEIKSEIIKTERELEYIFEKRYRILFSGKE